MNPNKDLSSGKPDIPRALRDYKHVSSIIDDNPFRDQMPTKAMNRTGFGKLGKAAKIQINSHIVTGFPTREVYQYDVSLCLSTVAGIADNSCRRSSLETALRSADSSRRYGSQTQSNPSLAEALYLMGTRLGGKLTMSHDL